MSLFSLVLFSLLGFSFAQADNTAVFNEVVEVLKANEFAPNKCELGSANYEGIDGLLLYGFPIKQKSTVIQMKIEGEGRFTRKTLSNKNVKVTYKHLSEDSGWVGSSKTRYELSLVYNPTTKVILELVGTEDLFPKTPFMGDTTLFCK